MQTQKYHMFSLIPPIRKYLFAICLKICYDNDRGYSRVLSDTAHSLPALSGNAGSTMFPLSGASGRQIPTRRPLSFFDRDSGTAAYHIQRNISETINRGFPARSSLLTTPAGCCLQASEGEDHSMKANRMIARVMCAALLASTLAGSLSASAGQALLSAGFESGLDGFSARGSETLSRVNTAAFDGQYSLLVSNRGNAWNGASVSLGTGWTSGDTYAFSAAVRQDSGTAVDMQLSLQYADAAGTTQYVQVAAASVPSGEWTVLSNLAYTIPAGATDRHLYVETASDLCDFYVDSVNSELPSTYRSGDVNHDDVIDKLDVTELQNFLKGQSAVVNLDTADMNSDKTLTAEDLTLLRQFFFYPELTRTTTTTTTTTTTVTTSTTPSPALKPGQWNNTADISWIDTSKPMVAISFDDGPVSGANYAARIQDALTKSGFHATFFYWGNRINGGNQSEILEAEKRGFEVANHTWTHTDLSTLGANDILREYTQCKDKLNEILGVNRDYLVRLPFLGYSTTVAQTLPVPCPNCGLDSADWNGASKDAIIQKVVSEMNSGALNGKVVLMHETYDTTASAMEYLSPLRGYL